MLKSKGDNGFLMDEIFLLAQPSSDTTIKDFMIAHLDHTNQTRKMLLDLMIRIDALESKLKE